MTIDQALAWATLILTVGGVVGIVWKVIVPLARKTKSLLNSLDRFTTDWFGEEASPGRDAVPGVMERLNNIDGELKHNGGSTMKDALKRVEKSLGDIHARLEEGNARFDDIETRINDLDKKDS